MDMKFLLDNTVTFTKGVVIPTSNGLYKIGDGDIPVTVALSEAIGMANKLHEGAAKYAAAAKDLTRLIDNRIAATTKEAAQAVPPSDL